MELIELISAEPVDFGPVAPALEPCTAELAECTCPDFCERDHANE
jgi:hypothetical protein